jgi:hypothetical protein
MLQDRTVETRIRDLSSSGISFPAPAPLPLLSRVQIALELPDPTGGRARPSLAITGVVVRCDKTLPDSAAPYDTAIYFEDLSDHARTQIARYLARLGS